jgi:hypothetical protein
VPFFSLFLTCCFLYALIHNSLFVTCFRIRSHRTWTLKRR